MITSVWERGMTGKRARHVYGPVPSRRLGRSLGVDCVPFKTCTYDCIYCHLGPTTDRTIRRTEYVPVDEVQAELEERLAGIEPPDYISLAGSGEPTLNSGLGDLIPRIKQMTRIPVAVLTNGSLLGMPEVQDALMQADLVIPSLDAGDGALFQYVNRPHPDISFERVVDGLVSFTNRFKGEVWLEVLLLAGVTGIRDEAEKIDSAVKNARLNRIQLNTAVRPPSRSYAKPVSPERLAALKGCFSGRVEIIADSGPAGRRDLPGRDVAGDEILALLSRRPCTAMDIARGLGMNASEAVKHLDALLRNGSVAPVRTGEITFYTTAAAAEASRP